MTGGKCDVCGKPSIGVASSSLGAVSLAFCQECANKPAEPLSMFQYMFDDVSDYGDGLRDEMNSFYTFKDGRYVSWPEYVAERRAATLFVVAELQPDADSPGLWIGFKTVADRERAMRWFSAQVSLAKQLRLSMERNAKLETELAQLRAGVEAIKAATVKGRVCDDVAWFDDITTLHDYCEQLVEGR